METFRKDLENLQSPRSFKYFYILGIIYMLMGVINFYLDKNHFWNSVLWFFSGIGFTISSFVERKKEKTFYIELNDTGIEAKLSFSNSLNIKWDDIEQITIKPISVVFHLKSGETKNLAFDTLSYKSVLEMKEKLNEFVKEKNIEIK